MQSYLLHISKIWCVHCFLCTHHYFAHRITSHVLFLQLIYFPFSINLLLLLVYNQSKRNLFLHKKVLKVSDSFHFRLRLRHLNEYKESQVSFQSCSANQLFVFLFSAKTTFIRLIFLSIIRDFNLLYSKGNAYFFYSNDSPSIS